MKRVVFLAAAAATLVQFTKYDLTALQTLGCEIHMVCNMQEGNISQAALQEYNQMFPQLHWHDLPFSDSAGAVRRNHAAYEKLVPLLKELQPDLLHCRGTIAGWYGRRAAQELQIPVFYTATISAFSTAACWQNGCGSRRWSENTGNRPAAFLPSVRKMPPMPEST